MLEEYLRYTLQDAAIGQTAHPILNLPRIAGFQSWPQIQLGGQYWDEIRKAKNLRLWWSADTNGFRWDKNRDETRIAFCPQAVRISFRNKVGEDRPRGGARRAPGYVPRPLEPVLSRHCRPGLRLSSFQSDLHSGRSQSNRSRNLVSAWFQLLAGKLEQTDLRFDKWYQDAVQKEESRFSGEI